MSTILEPARPSYFDQKLLEIGGLNPYGEARLRVVWGQSARCFRAGNPDAIKYINYLDESASRADEGMPCWIIEQWWAASSFGTPEDWGKYRYIYDETGAKVDLLGEYPSRGSYVILGKPLINNRGERFELDEKVLNKTREIIRFNEQTTFNPAENARRVALAVEAEQAERRKKTQNESDTLWEEYLSGKEKADAATTRQYGFNNQQSTDPRSPSRIIIPSASEIRQFNR